MALTSKKEEDGLAFYNGKSTIIQEARVFNDSPISPRKCRALLTRIVYLLYVGESFGSQEATTLFFGTTKLFQHKDVGGLMGQRVQTVDECCRARYARWSTWRSRSSRPLPRT